MPAKQADPLEKYWSKRDFGLTTEPRGRRATVRSRALSFVIQKHAATRLHYDFRLELDGVLLSWAVPKGPSFDPTEKRMAIHVEDHPLSYGSFEGTIPPKQYGAGSVIVWDNGTWEPVGDPHEGMQKGKLLFHLHGQKLAGLWELVKIAKGGERQEPWILFKKRDSFARPRAEYDVISALPDSVIAKPLAPAAAAGGASSAGRRKSGARQSAGDMVGAGAVKAPSPLKLDPQLATLATGVPTAGQWIYEIKFDGYRLMTRIENGKAKLLTRGGHDWTAKMPDLKREAEQLGVESAWLDGEIVVLDERGVPKFNALQNAFDRGTGAERIIYFLFDAPYFEGYDLRDVPLRDRRQLLGKLLAERGTDRLRLSQAFEADPASILSSACRMGLEGVMAKRADAPYASRRTETWLKLKCQLRQEFVIAGYTDRTGGPAQVGSLLLGVHDAAGALVSVGSVGTGWGAKEAAALKQRLSKIEIDRPPFAAGAAKPGRWSKRSPGSERWVQPMLVAEVAFSEWTPDGQIRHPSYVALRADKPAAAIVREIAKQIGAGPIRTAKAAVGGIKVSHGDRVIDPSTGLTKLDLVRYYESVADWMLPHLQGRPCALVRGPSGIAGELFFQKHDEKISIPGIREMDPALWPGHAGMLEVPTAHALASAAQMNVIEFHTWNSTARAIDNPDRIIFDLDPGEGTSWQHVQDAAVLVRVLLNELGLEAWLKTSGGKGLHVVVPIAPRLDYDTVKGFSQAVVQHLARAIPSRFVTKSGPANRKGKLFVDYLRNGYGATTAAAFSARARPGLGVSMPVTWEDLAELKSGAHWTIATAREHLSFQTINPWAAYWKRKQTLSGAMKKLGYPA
ncbi:bifunctional non-homologous end joining protein LigD [Variovorax sp. HW608]|uniref:DNA ligase D n=1 Tax=Variovorax sp. HW608 TaxID=1034889 RepID=UPI0008200BBB|nr:DNA ligase D [Variovorax sp. HW608]SCK08890.1 bifunctional non-homologous end joining protein LigD [Variovorax sp. HW608]